MHRVEALRCGGEAEPQRGCASPAASIYRAANGAPLAGGRFVAPPLIVSPVQAHRAGPHERPWRDRRAYRAHAGVLLHRDRSNQHGDISRRREGCQRQHGAI